MRKLTDQEHQLLRLIYRAGGSWCPDDAAWAEPAVRSTLKGLVSKKCALEQPNDGAPPRFTLTGHGMAEAAHG